MATVTAIKYNSVQEWHAIRSQGIGGSDVSAILGINPWKSPVQVWIEKTGQGETEVKNNRALEIGSYLEEMVAHFYAQETGNKVQKYNYTLVDDIFVGNIDRLVIPNGKLRASNKSLVTTNRILECKTSSDYKWPSVPLYYQSQVQYYMGFLPQIETADVAVYYKPCSGFQVFSVERDNSVISDLREFTKEWHTKYIVKREMPKPTCENDCRMLWKWSRGESIDATMEITETVERLKKLQEEKKLLEEVENQFRYIIASYMGENDTLINPVTGEKILTYKTSKDREKTDYNGLVQALCVRSGLNEEELNTLRYKFTTSTPGSRVMLVTKTRKGK